MIDEIELSCRTVMSNLLASTKYPVVQLGKRELESLLESLLELERAALKFAEAHWIPAGIVREKSGEVS